MPVLLLVGTSSNIAVCEEEVRYQARKETDQLILFKFINYLPTPVVSLPVPEVVGMAISGVIGPGTGNPFPNGGLT